jgi:hypothetical protein
MEMRTIKKAPLAALVVAASLALLTPMSRAELTQREGVRVSVTGKLTPAHLPRNGTAPIAVSVGGEITSSAPSGPPQLKKLTLEINSHGHLFRRGLPNCWVRRISPSTSLAALAACPGSLVGEGHFSANVKLPAQSPFPSEGRLLAFNGLYRGRPALLAHIYGTKPVPTSYVLPFLIHNVDGTYGTVLEASLPEVTGNWGFVTGVSITLTRRYMFRGHRRSYLAAGCPAPKGLQLAAFPLLRTSFAFDGGLTLTTTLNRSCRVE